MTTKTVQEVEELLSVGAVRASAIHVADLVDRPVPVIWKKIVQSTSADERKALALSLWGPVIRRATPTFFRKFSARLEDVIAFDLTLDGTRFPVLAYVCGTSDSRIPRRMDRPHPRSAH